MFIKILAILLLSLSITLITLPQERQGRGNFTGGTITGKVLDSLSHEPIEYANVVIISTRDSSVITGAVTNKEGIFNITGVRPGKLIAEVRFIGYYDKRFEIGLKPGSMSVDFEEIFLNPAAINLDDVVVEGERSPVSYQIDKKVIDVSQMPIVISGNAADLLENVPSVTVDIEGNVSLRGSSNFTVLIDGRPSVLDAQDALQQIAASTIDKIEIITNPSAKYDPEGTAGIINIILKKSKNSGWSGIANANAGLNEKYGGDFLFEYKNQSYKTTFSLDYNRRFFPGNSLEENTYFRENNTSFVN